MGEKLIRVGTTYLPVSDVKKASGWYQKNLGAKLSYEDEDKAIVNFANQSFFLVKAIEKETANFTTIHDIPHFSLTFEVDGLKALESMYKIFKDTNVKVGPIEKRGHSGQNFVFWDLDNNMFDVWSELSPIYKSNYNLE
ncbi:VOC family protein [Aquibacillus kalidii]|uniref:VOC family protein n=1 Tax=Aquibacillus kalidii TaxID=2762597 RepID=UPI001646EA48|nr:VOC family protein [Aquibacillus kalidii]